eukprot:TRINITY_DN7624_c0_g1_i2.p1 TRINITY_DN7624_c0_g1~~TRINITY_DN7624_c0_g1_i2.p1  ORF type:complete len:502 (+),score=100.27 TRINITY_DN7624_c0_g1_i2:109-1614(+)
MISKSISCYDLKADDYSDGRLQYEQRRPPPPPNNFVKVPPAPSPPNIHSDPNSAPSSASFHGALPPPPPPPFSSGEDPSSNFQGQKQQLPPPSPLLGPSRTMFTYGELSSATNGFSQSNLLGQGGFGCVYKGILANGQSVAVKQLKAGSGQGEREFQAEVEIISRVHHRHLVSLIGYCMTGSQRLLVYEFVSNNTLDYHLHTSGLPTMPWATRLKIAVGAARGLAYLHEDCYPKIIHRDIKSSNILLDSTFEAKVADFGLAKIASEDFTHVSTRVMGTFGYLAPEYAASGKLTEKSDVFSFGVVLLEMITGRKPVDTTQSYVEDSLVEWARPLLLRALEDGNPEPLVDPRLGNDYDREQMMRLVACAASSVRHSARKRPRMGQILRVLEGDVSLDDLHRGVRPGHSTMYSSFGSSDYDTAQYGEDMKKFRKMAFASQEYTSEYSGLNSRGQQLPSGSSSETMSSRETDPPNRSAGFHRRTYISSPEDHKTTKGRLDSDEFP